MPMLYISTFAPDEGMDDEWSLFLSITADKFIHCRVVGEYMNYSKMISDTDRPDNDFRYKDSIMISPVKESVVFHFRELCARVDVNNHSSFFNSHEFVRLVMELLDRDKVIDTSSPEFKKGYKWIQRNYASGLPG